MGFCFILKHKITLFYLISIVFICSITRCHSLLFFITHCHSLSLVVIHCHSLSFLVTRCATRCTIRCHSLYHSLSLIVTRCHSSYHWSVFLQTIFSDWVTVLKWKKAILNPTSCYSKVLNNREEGQNKRMVLENSWISINGGCSNEQGCVCVWAGGGEQVFEKYEKTRFSK